MVRSLVVGPLGLVIAVGLLAPGGASAATAPEIVGPVAISGVARDGELLTAHATWTGDPEPTAAWTWLRCDATRTNRCEAIAGATAASYPVVAADVGFVLRVRVIVTNTVGSDEARSGPTSVVEPPPPPPPPPDPTPEPTPEPTPSPTPVPDDTPPPPSFEVPPVIAPTPAADGLSGTPLLRPFPLVRIRGRLTATGARITLLTVRSPRGVRIAARCRGASCPVRRVVRTTASRLTRLRPLERRLRARTRLDIIVRKRGYIGKWTTIVIRRGLPPRRADRCVKPGRSRPTACPVG